MVKTLQFRSMDTATGEAGDSLRTDADLRGFVFTGENLLRLFMQLWNREKSTEYDVPQQMSEISCVFFTWDYHQMVGVFQWKPGSYFDGNYWTIQCEIL